ncbi:MAG: metal ABC transporter permease [Pseudanabaenaceae cyanobacterium SKYGB_i_bin29]|nr:metal ABC transporter permease [Pseudanabaenaceae cyanobacterium SKYG29]MDW8420729.1 metal ABC transporter permease [Pseudanabaenaceae cyanobacterium SKYGB_i_bin29]
MVNLLELLQEPFMQRALWGGVLLGILGGLLGCFVILRGLSLFGDTLGHASILGVVIAALTELPPTPTLILFAVIFGITIRLLAERTHLGEDTILGVALAGSVSLALIGFTFVRGFRGNLTAVLFGDILAISNSDLVILVVLLAVVITGIYFTLPQQVLISLSIDLARVKKIPVLTYQYSFVILLAAVIALSLRAAGILLVNGFLVIPAATARLLCNRFIPFLMLSATIGVLSAVTGVVTSAWFNLPCGPCIILLQILSFLGAVISSRH